jgi:release factor glutamine methyltransferase
VASHRSTARRALAARLAAAGFVAADAEAGELLERAGDDEPLLDALVARRLTGEPLAWITGTTAFLGLTLQVHPGVYVPRPHTEDVARRAIARLPADGAAIDLCTGCGAVAAALQAARPGARVVASDLDPRAVANARANGVEAFEGDLFDPLPDLACDVVCGVVPYVPTDELRLLHRDVRTFESPLPYDGGPDGADVLRRAIAGAAARLRPGGALVLELGGEQAALVEPELRAHGLAGMVVIRDEDGDPRGIEATVA